MNQEDLHRTRNRWRLVLTMAALAALIILIYSLRKQIVDVVQNLGKVNAFALLFLIPIEAINYDAYARLYKSLFATLGNQVTYREMYKVNLELNFVNHILPSGGISGVSYFGWRLRGLGVSGARATLAQVMKFFLVYISFQPLLILGLLFLAAHGHVNNFILVLTTSIITLLVVGTLIGVYIIEDRGRIKSFLTYMTRALNWLIHLVRPRQPETINIVGAQKVFDELHENYQIFKANWRDLKMPYLYMTIANITEVAAVYVVYIAFGQFVNVGAVILAYAVANFAGLISILPAGIGIYEGLMTAVLAATGIAAKLSIPVTLMYRVLNMFIQLVPGYILYQRAVRGGIDQKNNHSS